MSIRSPLLRRGVALEWLTLGWNVAGVPVLTISAIASGSVAAASFGLDSAIEIGASAIVIRQITGSTRSQASALRLLAFAFIATAAYVTAQVVWVVVGDSHPDPSPLAIGWNAATVVVMAALASGKGRVGAALDHPVIKTEARVTLVDAWLAGAILAGLVLNRAFGWWWADPLSSLVVVAYAIREARAVLVETA